MTKINLNLVQNQIELEGGKKKMKSVILMTTLLMIGIFAGVFVLAGTENAVSSSGGSGARGSAILTKVESENMAVSVSQIKPIEIETEDVEVSLQEVEAVKGYKKIGFAKVWRGNGWIDNNQEGYLITGFWASQKFAKVNISNKEIANVKTIRTFGTLRIAKDQTYRLIRAPTTEEIENTKSVRFYVVLLNKKKYLEEADLARDAVGKLILDKKEKFKGLTTWDGTLSFKKGNLAGSWDVKLGTNVNAIQPAQVRKIRRVIGEVQKTRVRINQSVSIGASESSIIGEVEKEIQIKPIEIKRKKFLFIIPTKQKVLKVEVTKDGETYIKEIKANEVKQIEDYSVSVGDLKNEDDIELKIE
jgi:hypothetical protein